MQNITNFDGLQDFALPTFGPGKMPGRSSNPYLACLIDPGTYSYRIPDEYSNQTALYSSRSYYDVYGNTGAGTSGSDIGKFAFYIRPVLGLPVILGPSTAQVSSVRPSAAWPGLGNWGNLGIFDYHSDPNILTLVGNASDGIVREIRPVAMSTWFQYTAPTLTLGGHVSCALTDGNHGNWSHNSESTPIAGLPLQEYRSLSLLPNSYNGKITEGCYAFYKPYDAEDIIFQNATEPGVSNSDYGVKHTYPTIVIAGQVISTSGSYAGIIGRIQVDIIFEYVTFSRVVESIPSPVDPPMIWNARLALKDVRTCMANEEHESFIKKMLHAASSLVSTLAPTIGGAVGTMIGGPAAGVAGRRIGKTVQSVLSPAAPKTTPKKPKPKKKKQVPKRRQK